MADFAAGRVTVPVIPSVSGIQGTISKAFAGTTAPVGLVPKIDSATTKAFASAVPPVKLDAEDRALNAKLEAAKKKLADLEKTKTSPEIDAKITAAQAKLDQLQAELRDLQAKPSTPKVDADIAAAKAKIATVESSIERLEGMRASPKLDADIAAAKANVAVIEHDVKAFGERRAVAEVAVRDDGQSEGRMAALFNGIKGKAATLAPAFAAAGLAAGAALAVAITQAVDISDARAKLSAQLGLTPPEAARYGRIAGQVYSQAYGESLDQVNDALAAVTRNIGGSATSSDQVLQGVTGTVLNLSDAFGIDLGESTRAVGTILKNGLAPNAQVALDVLTRGLQTGANSAGDLTDTFTEYPTLFRNLGLDAGSAMGLLTQGLQAGARDSDKVADALKEFSIRAVDGSKLTATGFEMIGLNAGQMATAVGQGGQSATSALQAVLDHLRDIPDPVKRSQAAVALFGTQAEDLGDALYALDPSTAVKALGEVGGAADAMNTTLGETASSRIETFKRSLQTGIVDFIGGVVLPPLMALGDVGASLFGSAWDGVRSFLGFLAGTGGVVVAVILGIAGAIKLWTIAQIALDTAFLSSPITWIVLAIVGLVAVVIYAWNHFEGFRDVVLAVWDGIKTAAGAVWSFLSTIFGAIGSAVSAVGSFFVWLWQSVIVPAATAIGAAFSWLWDNVLSPVFSAIGLIVRIVAAVILAVFIIPITVAVSVLGAIFTWLWTNAVQPAVEGIAALAVWLWTNVLSPVWSAIQVGISAVGAFFSWLWTNAVQPALAAIGAFAGWLWNTILAPTWAAIQAGITLLGSFFTWLWVNGVQPIFSAIGTGAQFLWSNVVQPVFSFFQAGIQALGAIFSWLWNNAVEPAFSGIGSVVSSIWNGVIRPVFDGIKSAVSAVGDAFGWAVDKIGDVWGRIQAIVRPPVEFVVNAVYNHGIRPAWNFIAGLFDLGQLPELTFAGGGLVPGYAPGRDRVPALLSPGEGILVPEAVKLLGAKNVLALNAYASSQRARGMIPTPLQGDIGVGPGRKRGVKGAQRFADGGIVGWLWDKVEAVGDFVGGVADFLSDPLSAVTKVFGGVDTSGLGGLGTFSQALFAIPKKTVSSAVDWLKGLFDREGASGAAGAGAGLAFAMSQRGKPYVWGSAGPGGYDCSGFMAAITNVMRGQNPYSRLGTTASMPWRGFTPGDNSVFVIGSSPSVGGGYGHMAGRLLGHNVESAGSVGVRVDGPVGPTNAMFGTQYGFRFDSGGYLPPGDTLVHNGTGRPEAVFTASQWATLSAGHDGGPVEFTGDLYLDSGELLGVVHGVVDDREQASATSLSRGRSRAR